MRLEAILFSIGVSLGLLVLGIAHHFYARPTPAEAVVSTIEETMPLLPPSELTHLDKINADIESAKLLEKLSTDPIHHAQHVHRLKDLLPQVSDATLVSIARSPVVAWVPLIDATNREISCRLLLRLPPP